MVNRQTLTANTNTDFDFNNQYSEFTVKNFTSGYILVCPDTYVEANAYKIPTMTAQTINVRTNKLVINAASGGEVEVNV